MNDFEYDLLTRIAFGEAEPGDRAELDRLVAAKPEARDFLEQFSSLKADIGTLGDIPECQLSTERLRAAILEQSKPKPRVIPMFGWGLAAAAAAVVGVFLINRSRVDTSTVAQNEAPTATSLDRVQTVTPSDLGTETLPTPSEIPTITPSPEVKFSNKTTVIPGESRDPLGILSPAAPTRARKEARTPTRRDSPDAPSASAAFVASAGGAGGSAEPGFAAAAPAAAVRMATAKLGSGEPVVLVSDMQDPETGARSATEVTPTQEVEFSG